MARYQLCIIIIIIIIILFFFYYYYVNQTTILLFMFIMNQCSTPGACEQAHLFKLSNFFNEKVWFAT